MTQSEPILAWRNWLTNEHGDLRSVSSGTVWPRGEKLCSKCGLTLTRPGICDREQTQHHCGIHANRHERQSSGLWCTIYGRVSLWGRIYEHEHGFRAEYAYPYDLFVPRLYGEGTDNACRMRGLREYGVDIQLTDDPVFAWDKALSLPAPFRKRFKRLVGGPGHGVPHNVTSGAQAFYVKHTPYRAFTEKDTVPVSTEVSYETYTLKIVHDFQSNLDREVFCWDGMTSPDPTVYREWDIVTFSPPEDWE